MKSIEILGMKQARSWDMASLNEFRKFFGLKEHKTFEDICPDPKVAGQMQNLYETPDQVELYTGQYSSVLLSSFDFRILRPCSFRWCGRERMGFWSAVW